jgi:adhesin HecA-like repeat protein
VTGGTVDVEGSGGSLSVSSLEISGSGASVTGSGQVNVSGIVSNNGSISGGGLTLTAAGLNNTGTLQANGSLTVNVNGGGFTNLSGSTLTGGTYQAGGQDSFGHPVTGTLDLNVGGLIISDAANIVLTGAISSFDNVSNSYVPLQSSLAEIASSGTLSLLSQTYNSDALTDDGTLKLYGATFTSPQLTINSDGLVSGTGTMTTTITNAGMIIAGHQQAAAER